MDGEPRTHSALDDPTKDLLHFLGTYPCSVGHQCLVNTSPLISLSNELGVGMQNMVSFTECLLCAGDYTRCFPSCRHMGHYSDHSLYRH